MTGFATREAAQQRDPTVVGRCCRAAVLSIFVFATNVSFSAAPDIDSIAPRALLPGIPVEVKFTGSDLSEATSVWTSFPADSEALGEGRWRIKPPADWPVGIGAMQFFGSNGVSSLTLVMLDDLPTESETKTNKTRAAAQMIHIGNAVDGHCDELGFDWYRLRPGKSQRVSIEIVAARLGSRLDSVLRVMDARGRIVAQNEDAPGLRADSFVSFTAADAGDYFVELRDVNYGGGAEFFYHLRVGDFTLATTVFPVGAEQGRQHSFQLTGPDGVVGPVQANPLTNAVVVSLAFKGHRGSTFVQALTTTNRESMEREPNDKIPNATKVSLAEGINGRFDKAGDRDCYEFTARKGQRLEFRAATRSVGSPCDVMMELQSEGGARLARSNPSAADEGIVTHRFATNGTYCLIVEEATGAFGPNCIYRIETQPAAGFTLTMDNDRVNVAAGKTFDLKVTCARGDYKGAVTLSIKGEGESSTVTNEIIGEGKTNTTMKVTVPEHFAPGRPRFFTVIGTATRDGAEVRVPVTTAPALRKRFPQMLYLPLELDGVIALGVTASK